MNQNEKMFICLTLCIIMIFIRRIISKIFLIVSKFEEIEKIQKCDNTKSSNTLSCSMSLM